MEEVRERRVRRYPAMHVSLASVPGEAPTPDRLQNTLEHAPVPLLVLLESKYRTHHTATPPPFATAPGAAGRAAVFTATYPATPARRVLDHPESGGQALVGCRWGWEGGGFPGGGRGGRHMQR